MPAEVPPVTGPFRISVEAIPTGVTLDITSFVEALVLDLVTEHADALAEILDEQADGRPYDGFAAEGLLVERLVAQLSTRIPVYGGQCLALADRIRAVAAPKVMPQQRAAEGGAAA
ncbi:hypothetical protein FCH28_09570 [Streptomyces piniterrae]|uniref:Uncharacterized protein n=1 Tax=Streptomyces piniterrae TaxID=2571125 RepID=A0A4U0NMS0_9ACTN|nr:hypothetical protein [Streptomyces piniterrae]TJZ55580.1 hypothetical protein FCH28_09570 [Streptomyces piniterrae]